LRRGKLVDNQVEEKKDEHIETSETLQREKGKQVINDVSSSAAPNLETPYEPEPEPHSQNVSRHPLTLGNEERKYKQ
jgi:hypothetical protein